MMKDSEVVNNPYLTRPGAVLWPGVPRPGGRGTCCMRAVSSTPWEGGARGCHISPIGLFLLITAGDDLSRGSGSVWKQGWAERDISRSGKPDR
ncbi:hypothetical protein E2C01_072230 [Portunus trituberculatus]|uniref:Uncharacterized protein n=1 Tax=Portunus trituberculatus TaxID=210409 RepID=A0A5B7IAN4_PORTR|nr:hypothetical protein [Portunus trituberculatus]